MSATFAILNKDEVGLSENVRVTMEFDAPYTTGGVAVSAADFPFRVKTKLDKMCFAVHPTFAFEYERATDRTGKILVYDSAGGLTEVANGTDLSGVSLFVTAQGR